MGKGEMNTYLNTFSATFRGHLNMFEYMINI